MINFSSNESMELIKSSIFRTDIIESFCYQRSNCRCGLACLETILYSSEKFLFNDNNLEQGFIPKKLSQNP